MEEFEGIYKKHRNVVLRYAFRCIGRRDVAEELAAEAFLELHRHWTKIDTDRLPAWLFTVVKNRAADYLRRLQLESHYLSSEQPPLIATPVDARESMFDHPALKPVHRICLTLRYVHGMTLPEIGKRIGVTETQVKGYLQYARGLLRKELAKEEKQ